MAKFPETGLLVAGYARIDEGSEEDTPTMLDQILALAREWAIDRRPRDGAERALYLAVVNAYPNDFRGKETCSCGCPESCDDCPTEAQAAAYIEQLRKAAGQDVFARSAGIEATHQGR